MTVVILAGGQATRMQPWTREVPKLLLPVGTRPFAEWQLALLQAQGFRDIVYCVGHLGDRIRGFLGDGSTYGMEFQYSDEGEARLGTGGAILKALPLLGHKPFLTLYGDSYLDCDYAEIVTRAHAGGFPNALTTYQGVDYGMSLLHPWSLHPWAQTQACSLQDIHRGLDARGMLAKLAMPHPWEEIGSPESYTAFCRRIEP